MAQEAIMGAGHPGPSMAPATPHMLPLARVTVYPSAAGAGYVTLAMQELAPIFTADGAMIYATAPGTWDQLALPGGGRHG
jgi:hypothetical protein